VGALRNWEAVLVELERSRAIRRLSPAAHRRLSALIPLGARLFVERGATASPNSRSGGWPFVAPFASLGKRV
jgi:hypothetical protein